MKGYRKLMVGEKILKGDVFDNEDGRYLKTEYGVGREQGWDASVQKTPCQYYRPLPNKAKRVKKFNLDIELSLLCPDRVKRGLIIKFIRRNYRRVK